MTQTVNVAPGRRPAGWLRYLAVASVVIVLFYLAPRTGDKALMVQSVLYSGLGFASAIAVWVGVRRHRPSNARAWRLIIAGQLTTVAGDVTFFVTNVLVGDDSYPSVADALYLSGYPLLAGGLFILVRSRTPGWDVPSAIDATIVAISAGMLTWFFVISPIASTPDQARLAQLVSTGYPMMDLLLLVVAVRLMLGAGVRTMAFRLLVSWLSVMLAADAVYAIQTTTGAYSVGTSVDGMYMVGMALLGAAGLHPSMRQLTERSPVAAPEASIGRLAVLAIASVIAPATLLVQSVVGAPLHVTVTALTCIVLFLLVLVRMAGLVATQRQTAITDGLTGLRTRRFFEESLRSAVDRATRSDAGLGVLLLDVDRFKAVNDTHGHHGGDLVLVEVARRLRDLVRRGDVVARYGGEEFAVLMPNTSLRDLETVAERLRHAIGTTPVTVDGSTVVTVTISIGAAAMPPHCNDHIDLVLTADRALYAAKSAGRNRIISAVPNELPELQLSAS